MKSLLHTVHASALIVALIFGQVGAGFLHNKHDAHESIIDLDNDVPVLLNHGEHCKVCAVDWVHQFLAEDFDIVRAEETFGFSQPVDVNNFLSLSSELHSSRAPPQGV